MSCELSTGASCRYEASRGQGLQQSLGYSRQASSKKLKREKRTLSPTTSGSRSSAMSAAVSCLFETHTVQKEVQGPTVGRLFQLQHQCSVAGWCRVNFLCKANFWLPLQQYLNKIRLRKHERFRQQRRSLHLLSVAHFITPSAVGSLKALVLLWVPDRTVFSFSAVSVGGPLPDSIAAAPADRLGAEPAKNSQLLAKPISTIKPTESGRARPCEWFRQSSLKLPIPQAGAPCFSQ